MTARQSHRAECSFSWSCLQSPKAIGASFPLPLPAPFLALSISQLGAFLAILPPLHQFLPALIRLQLLTISFSSPGSTSSKAWLRPVSPFVCELIPPPLVFTARALLLLSASSLVPRLLSQHRYARVLEHSLLAISPAQLISWRKFQLLL